jgi:hypothetical protein
VLLGAVLAEVKVPEGPVAHGCPQLEWGAQEDLEQPARWRIPGGQRLICDRVPGRVLNQPVYKPAIRTG